MPRRDILIKVILVFEIPQGKGRLSSNIQGLGWSRSHTVRPLCEAYLENLNFSGSIELVENF